MKSVLIYPNMSKQNINEAIEKICTKLEQFDAKVFMSNKFTGDFHNKIAPSSFSGDLIITLGGDGTMLTAINECKNIPILGFNLGHLGFLTELEIYEIDFLDKIFSENYTIDTRMMLDVQVQNNGQVIAKNKVLNDVIIKTEDSFRIMHLHVKSDDVDVLNFSGDGIIISTPTGSTAYSLAAGGPIIDPLAESICVTPICSHKFAQKSFVFSTKRVITLNTKERNENLAYIAFDGNNALRINPDDIVKISKSDIYVPFIRVKNQKFYNILREKIGG